MRLLNLKLKILMNQAQILIDKNLDSKGINISKGKQVLLLIVMLIHKLLSK